MVMVMVIVKDQVACCCHDAMSNATMPNMVIQIATVHMFSTLHIWK
jgi:hypothetical protein